MIEKEGNVYNHKEIKATPKEFSGTKTFAFCVCKRLREKRRKPVEYPRGGGGGVMELKLPPKFKENIKFTYECLAKFKETC